MNTIILKLGGSVVTQKHRTGVFIRRKLLARIARECVDVLSNNKKIQLLIVHGAGSGGHQLADKYGLKSGVNGDPKKLYGSLATRIACQKLNLVITEILLQNGLSAATVHTASNIFQNNKRIASHNFDIIDRTLENKCIPVLYGEMVYDDALGMSVCSGDAIVMWLADKYNAEKIIFASDIDGIFDKDPHLNNDAKLIKSTDLESIQADNNINLSGSHSVDVTGGLKNKIAVLAGKNLPKNLKKVIVCNGLKAGIITKAMSDNEHGTIIKI